MKDKSDNPNEQENLVITPGGPRHKELIHSVGPEEVVSIDESGKARVIPRKQQGEAVTMTQDMVLTPGGYRHRSLVHTVEPGHILDVTGGHLRKLTPSGEVMADFGVITARPGMAATLGSGWISDASWTNNSGTPISSFTATWVVPAPPTTQSGQLIYLFNGLEPSDGSWIYQPVLQWGISQAGGGNNWAVASWYVAQASAGGQAFLSELTPVNPGDILVGVMTLTNHFGTTFNYNCQFQGIANSGLQVTGIAELTRCFIVMEAYQITQCSDYPNTPVTAFTSINIQTGSSTPAVSWTPDNKVTDCGQYVVVVTNSGTNGEVDLNISPPIVTSITPTSGPIAGGTPVSVSGSGFTGVTGVGFGSIGATNIIPDSTTPDTLLIAVSPTGSGTVNVTVITPGGTSATSSADQFTYNPPPTVTGINPNTGPAVGNMSVVIAGTGFTGATIVNFGSTAANSFNVDSDIQITATNPASNASITVDVTVITPNGTSTISGADQFTYM